MIGLGIVSYERPRYRADLLASVTEHLTIDFLTTAIDVSPVARAKNQVLSEMLAAGCDWLFVAEDDVVVTSPEAVTGYVRACEQSGMEHLMFHAHGPANPRPKESRGVVTIWPNWVGAWNIYSAASLRYCGLMDEHFHNAWEHVEHSARLAAHGHTAPGAPDATGSEAWLREQPGALASSVIRSDPLWNRRMDAGKAYWRETYPDTYRAVFECGRQ